MPLSGFAVGQRPGQQPAILGAGGDLGVVGENATLVAEALARPRSWLAALGKIVNLDSVALGHGQPFAIATHSLNALVRTEVQDLAALTGKRRQSFTSRYPPLASRSPVGEKASEWTRS